MDLKVTLVADLDVKQVKTDLKNIEKQDITLSNVKFDTSALTTQLQKAINSATRGLKLPLGNGSRSSTGAKGRRVAAQTVNASSVDKVAVDNAKAQNKVQVLQQKQRNEQDKHNQRMELERQKAANKEAAEKQKQQNKIEVENVKQQHKLEIQQQRAEQKAAADAKKAQQKVQAEAQKVQKQEEQKAEKAKVNSNKIVRQVEDQTYEARQRVIDAQRTPYLSKAGSEEFQEVAASMREVEQSYRALQNATEWYKEGRLGVEELSEVYDDFNNKLTTASNKTKIFTTNQRELVSESKKTDAIKKLYEYGQKYSKAVQMFPKEFKALEESVKEMQYNGDYNKYMEDFKAFDLEATQAGVKKLTLGDQLKRGFKQVGQFVSTYTLYWQAIQGAQAMVKNVIDVDTAMTELRKVSDASMRDIDNYLTSATEHAKEYGAAVTDVVNATADWSRLGYSLPEADKLAQASLLYRNVGDNIDIDEANESLVSTLQGFQLTADDAISVIDKFNEVGNNFAIDTAGIGTSLSKSAASFQAANTSLSESIALVTAANEVVHLCLIA